MTLYEILSDHANIVCTQRYPTKSKRQPFKTRQGCYLFSSELKAASCSIAGLETQGELDNDGQRPFYPMDASAQANRSTCDRLVYKRYKSHLDLAISVLLFDRRFWDHVIIPMIAMSAILRPPNPQFATSEWFKRWISFKWFDKTETWKLRSIWSALGSSSALVPWTWTCQTERNSSTARQLDSSTHLIACPACPACPKALAQFRTWIQNQGNLPLSRVRIAQRHMPSDLQICI